jgi:Cd(II)/Pb(II)-responsive transcriptional regulator
MKIGDLAQATATTAETIRYYEREGLLPAPARTAGNYRSYGKDHVDRLSFIRYCRGLDMTLSEIKVLLHFKDAPGENCAEVNALLDEHLGHVATRIRELRQLQRQLRQLRGQCEEASEAARCGILAELTHASHQNPSPVAASERHVHVRGAHAAQPRRRGGG